LLHFDRPDASKDGSLRPGAVADHLLPPVAVPQFRTGSEVGSDFGLDGLG